MLHHAFLLLLFYFTLLYFIFQYRIEFIQGMERGVKRVVEAEKGRERAEKRSREIEAGHEHVKGS